MLQKKFVGWVEERNPTYILYIILSLPRHYKTNGLEKRPSGGDKFYLSREEF
ncbi:hypothetical protein [Nostoc sp.]|uniref:hypothetical protein n=1 Tax=Nostoc sp. TaxID=1180 RepID=UPI002FF975A1